MFNNNIGTIYVERVDATNSSGTLTYTTGISGTQGKEFTNPDGSLNAGDTQKIVVNTNSATLNINGAGGVDKFDIEASSFTKTLTIAGNLGTVPNYEEARNNYDTVRIDLSKTSGVNLDISRLLVSNPNDDGIQIVASKGADNITLVAGANHDVIEFTAGGGRAAVAEVYELDLGSLRLGQGQSVTIDGLTITNIAGLNGGNTAAATDVKATAQIFTAEDIASFLEAYLTGATTASGSAVSGTGMSKYVRFEGKLENLTIANGWLDSTGKADAVASGSTLTLTNTKKADTSDLSFSFGGNDRTNGFGAEANKAQAFVAGAAAASEKTSASARFAGWAASALTASAEETVNITFNGESYTLTIKVGSSAATAAFTAAALEKVLSGSSAGLTNVTTELKQGTATVTKIDGLSFSGSSSGTFVVSNLASGDTITIAGTEYAYTPATPAVQGQLTIDFGADGLLAGQSYSFLGKTVLATKDLTGEQIAEAFAFGNDKSSGVDGAVVIGQWGKYYTTAGAVSGSGSAGIDTTKVLFDISGSSLIIMEQTPGVSDGLVNLDSLEAAGKLVLTGTGTLAVRTDGVAGTTTVQGVTGAAIAADSYVTFAGIGTGSAASGADAGTVSAIKANTSMLDTITNFDISNDKLALKDVDGKALSFGKADMGDISTPTDAIYVDTLGSTLTATTGAGIISFGVTAGSGAATGADAITLDQKLYVAVNNIDDDKAVGFEHGGDTYVIVGSAGSGASTADLVIKLAGVTGVTDITSILA